MIFEANSYGLPFSDLLNFTYGELARYIEYHREKERRQLQEQSKIAYYQALMIGRMLSESDIGEPFECFPYWSEDEILEIRANQAMQLMQKYIY